MKKLLIALVFTGFTLIAENKKHTIIAPSQWKGAELVFENQALAIIKPLNALPVKIRVTRCLLDSGDNKKTPLKLMKQEVSFTYQHSGTKKLYHCKGLITE